MTYRSIKLLALAVICGFSLIGFAISGGGKANLLGLVSLVTGLWFVIYWCLFCGPDNE